MNRLRRFFLLMAVASGAALFSADPAAARGPCSDVIASDGSDCSVCESPTGCYAWFCEGGGWGVGCPE